MNLFDIYKELQSDLANIEEELHRVITSPYRLMQEASSHLLKAGGKRIRPVFVLLSGKSGSYDIQRLKHVAVALELIHMATLVHDDVIDDAETRRGQSTVKAKWDNRMAMYTGDYIMATSLHYITRLADPKIHQVLSKAMMEMCLGEIEQIKALYKWDQSLKSYFLRIRRKTALLMATSCQLGGIACGAETKVVQALYRYGYNVGMAFQITDDILDFTGTEQELGKPAGSDLLQGNVTLPVLASFKDPAVREEIVAEFSRGEPNISKLIRLVVASGGISCAKEIANKYILKAKDSLQQLVDPPSRETLLRIADFIEQRNF